MRARFDDDHRFDVSYLLGRGKAGRVCEFYQGAILVDLSRLQSPMAPEGRARQQNSRPATARIRLPRNRSRHEAFRPEASVVYFSMVPPLDAWDQ